MKSLVFTFGNIENVCIFAMLNIFITLTNASGACILMRAFLCLYLKYRGITIPPWQTVMECQHLLGMC